MRQATEPGQRPPHPSAAARRVIVLGAAVSLLAIVGALFWHEDWRYSLPTPRPAGYAPPQRGDHIDRAVLGELPGRSAGRPTFVHFYNPDCPCSRFNLDEVREILAASRARADFVAVVERADGEDAGPGDLQGLNIPVVVDSGGRIARACGVYSTPQAVILDERGRLYFRGNYNLSRYCADTKTAFARQALDRITRVRREAPDPGEPYGCRLPSAALTQGDAP